MYDLVLLWFFLFVDLKYFLCCCFVVFWVVCCVGSCVCVGGCGCFCGGGICFGIGFSYGGGVSFVVIDCVGVVELEEFWVCLEMGFGIVGVWLGWFGCSML